ncbi:type II toxin-antitoxin system VapC family toxin [Curtobacterium sp. Leaf261]|uniref:type II toxin-antitoxin system VapC family toxin n=1 Tax=Curtobacterium sp. Leaf261 TaxID=1736311 RepID=UPI0006FD02ED|nr:PIN domain-containing protein [Curtobacterium sp. Leaf261]KQO65161.1 hypothetical protein ASF23_03340 [Curtobacterium sp. Leaf261]
MIVLDASVLIALCDWNDVHHRRALAIFRDHRSEGMTMSALTVAESLVRPAREGTHHRVLELLGAMRVHVRPLTADDTVLLAKLRGRWGLRMPDAVVLHASLCTGAELATFDEALLATARSIGVQTVQVTSAEPATV